MTPAPGSPSAADDTRPDRTAPPSAGIRLPAGQPARYTALVLLAAVAGVLALTPGVPGLVSALLLMVFVGIGPGCAFLSWTGPPGISRLIVVPAMGLALTVVATTIAATVGWWAPHALFGIIALITIWSAVPNIGALVRDMVP